MKKITLVAISLLLMPLFVSAQTSTDYSNAGITPESRLYFLDKIGEALLEFFTFSADGRARLQIALAAERVAEIRAVLEEKGVTARGLDIAQERLQEHIDRAVGIIAEKKLNGDDVRVIASEINDELQESKTVLEQSFRDEKKKLENKKEALKKEIEAAKRSRDAASTQTLSQELSEVKSQLESLGDIEDEVEDQFEDDELEIEEVENESVQGGEAQKQIQEAEKKRLEVQYEFQKEGFQIPSSLYGEYNRLIGQAKTLLAQGRYGEAELYAKQAKASLEYVKREAENLRETQKQEYERVQKIEELQSEAEKKLLEEERERQQQEDER